MFSLLFFGLLGILSVVECNMTFKVEAISKYSFDLADGPFWDDRSQSIYHVNLVFGEVCRLNIATSDSECIHLNDTVSIVIPYYRSNHLLLVSLGNRIIKLDWTTKKYDLISGVVSERRGRRRFNDGKCDAMGRLWIADLLETPSGAVYKAGNLYRLDNHNLTKMSEDFVHPNGMAWNRNNNKMYLIDSEDFKIFVFDYDLKKGAISNKRIFLNFVGNSDFNCGEIPDGMTIDIDDNLWVAMNRGGRIVQIDSETGKVMNSVGLPSTQLTSLTFGGDYYDQIFCTSGKSLLSDKHQGLYTIVGKIYRVRATSRKVFLRGAGPANRYRPPECLMRSSVKSNVESDVKYNLESDLKSDIESNVESDVKYNLESYLKSDIESNVESDVKYNVESDLKSDIESNVESDVKSNVESDLKSDIESNVESDVKSNVESDLKSDIESNVESDVKSNVESDLKSDIESNVESDVKSNVESDLKSDIESNVESDVKSNVESDLKSDIESNVESDVKPNVESDLKSDIESNVESDVKPNVESDLKSDIESNVESDLKSNVESDVKSGAK